MHKFIEKILEKIENASVGFLTGAVSFLSIIIIRVLVENWLEKFRNNTGLFLFYEFTHTFLFFAIAYVLFVLLIGKFVRAGWKKVSNFLLFGYLIIITPPLLDYVISGGSGYWSFYKFDSLVGLLQRFLTFFGDKPEIGITFGVRIEVAISLIFIFIYSLIKLSLQEVQAPSSGAKTELKTDNHKNYFIRILNTFWNLELGNFRAGKKIRVLFQSLVITFAAYVIFFALGVFPSWITIGVAGFSKGFLNVNDVDIAQMFFSPASIFSRQIPDMTSSLNIKMSIIYSLVFSGLILSILFFNFRQKFLSFLNNFRFPQVIYHGGLLLVGLGLSLKINQGRFDPDIFNLTGLLLLLEAVLLAWLASVVINDFFDKKIDSKTNNKRPLIQNTFTENEYRTLGITLFLFSLLFAAIVSFKVAFFLLAYQGIAWLYSAWPLRLKRFAFVSTFVSSIASLMIVFSGFILASPSESIRQLPFSVIVLLTMSYTFSLPVKDFKDIDGDRNDGVRTIPVLFGENWGKIVVASGIFFSFLLSVAVFNEFRLFWWAMLFGGFSFWLVGSMQKEKGAVTYRNIFWWILGTTFGYCLVFAYFIVKN